MFLMRIGLIGLMVVVVLMLMLKCIFGKEDRVFVMVRSLLWFVNRVWSFFVWILWMLCWLLVRWMRFVLWNSIMLLFVVIW